MSGGDAQRPQRRDRTPIVLGVIAGVLAVAVAVTLGIALTRDQGAGEAEPATPAAPAPATGSTPSGEASAPSETDETSDPAMSVSATGFTITGADGETFTHEWADDPDTAVDALTDLFGEAPAEDFQNGDAENWAYDIYVWEGFRFYDVYLDGSDRERSEVPAPTYISYGAGVPVGVENDFGIEVGMTADQLDALGPDDAIADGGTAAYLFGEDRATFYQDGARTFGALVTFDGSDPSSYTITYTYAPEL